MQFSFEVGQASKDQTCHIDFIIGNETLYSDFGHFANEIVPFLHTESSESQCTLTTAAVFLRQIDGELGEHLARVTLQRAEQCSIAVDDNETKARIIGEQGLQCLAEQTRRRRMHVNGSDGQHSLQCEIYCHRGTTTC